MTPPTSSNKKVWLAFALTHLYASVTGVIALVYWFTFRELVSAAVIALEVSTWSWQFIDLITSIGYGLIWLCLVLACQHLYAKQLDANEYWAPKLFFYITGIQAVIFIATVAALRVMGSV